MTGATDIQDKRGVDAVYASYTADLEAFLTEHLAIDVRTAHLPEAQSLLVSTPHDKRHHGLVVSDQTTDPERLSLYIHTAAHLLLGHLDRPCAIIIEPIRWDADAVARRSPQELAREREADELAGKLLLGYGEEELTYACEEHTCNPAFIDHCQRISGILPGHNHDRMQHILRLGIPRRTIVSGLRLLRRLHIDFRSPMHGRGFMRELREVFCLAEVSKIQPDRAQRRDHLVPVNRSSPESGEREAA